MEGQRPIDGKFSVPYEYRRGRGLNQSFILFVKTPSIIPI
jgi:hypothetical protein